MHVLAPTCGARAYACGCDTYREGAAPPTKTMAGKEPTIFEQIRKEFGFMKNISSFNESNHMLWGTRIPFTLEYIWKRTQKLR